jgi:hypothetical protein
MREVLTEQMQEKSRLIDIVSKNNLLKCSPDTSGYSFIFSSLFVFNFYNSRDVLQNER